MTKPKPKPAPPPEPSATQSWDEMLAEVAAQARTTVIQGVTVKVPTETSMRFEVQLAELDGSGSEDDLRTLVADLYGTDALDQWVANGMTPTGFAAALGWGLLQAKGKTDYTFRQAYDLVLERQGNLPAANRKTRRAAAKPVSASTGGPSRPTSGGTTASRQRKSST